MDYRRTPSRRIARPSRLAQLLPIALWFLRLTLFLLLLGSAFWSWQWLKRSNILPVASVVIKGDYPHTPQKTLQTTITPFLSAGFLKFDAADLQEKLLQLPWMATVSIQRIWPNQIIIELRERQAVARWTYDALLDDQGIIFKPPISTFPANLPILNGPEDQAPAIWQQYQQMNHLLAALNLWIVELDLSSRHAWSLILNNGSRILLGHLDVLNKLNHFIKLYPQLFATRIDDLESVDLRYPNGMAVRWRDGKK